MAHHQGDVRDSSNALYGNNRFEGQVHFGIFFRSRGVNFLLTG